MIYLAIPAVFIAASVVILSIDRIGARFAVRKQARLTRLMRPYRSRCRILKRPTYLQRHPYR